MPWCGRNATWPTRSAEDTVIDQLNDQIFRELLTFMMEDPRTIHRSLLIMQISKNLERIADHAEGIADMVIYMVTGKSVRHQWPGDTPTTSARRKRDKRLMKGRLFFKIFGTYLASPCLPSGSSGFWREARSGPSWSRGSKTN